MKRFIISYREEFSTVVEAKNFDDAMKKVIKAPWSYQWELIGELHTDFLQHVTEHLTEDELYTLQS